MGISRRAAQNAIAALEARGFILIRRRELKVVDGVPGKRYYGGKGVANVYLPAIAGELIVATESGKRLVEWGQGQRQRAHQGPSKSAPACAPKKPAKPSFNLVVFVVILIIVSLLAAILS